jgi:hypothetical protein
VVIEKDTVEMFSLFKNIEILGERINEIELY